MGDVIITGGAESMSMVPMIGNKFTPNPYLASEYPGVYLGMGLTAENVARQYGSAAKSRTPSPYAATNAARRRLPAGRRRDCADRGRGQSRRGQHGQGSQHRLQAG